MTVVTAKIQVRRGTAAEWAAANPVLAEGEMSYETDTGFTKLGDGATEYADLPAYATYDQMVAAMAEIDETLDEAEAQVVLASGHRANAESARDVAIAAQNIASQQATIATSQASLAEGHAASAASVVQQDLSGITAQALHRSPNAITAMFLYDTSKDSDGGAWTEKCQHTSWWNEAINGKWLTSTDPRGIQSEVDARRIGATVGAELVSNGGFDSSTGWTVGDNWSIAHGAAAANAAVYNTNNLDQTVSLVAGRTYRVTFNVTSYAAGSLRIDIVGSITVLAGGVSAVGSYTVHFVAAATNAAASLRISGSTGAGFTGTIDNISVREVTALNTASGDYFQLLTDGKFYRLWQNHMTQSRLSAAGIGFSTGVSVTSDATLDVTGAPAQKLVVDSAGGATQFFAFFGSTQMPTLTANTNYVFSVEVKKGTLRYAGFTLDLFTGIPNATHLRYDLDTGLVDFASPQYLSHGILNLGNGWYRIWGLVNTGTSIGGARQFRVLADSDTNASDSSYSVPRDGEASHYVGRCQIDFAQLGPVEEKSGIGTISEVFRGNKRDFPRLAGIVAEASNVTIYDLTESGRPMWMRFDRRSTATWVSAYFGGNSSANVSSVSALNGLLVFSLLAGFGLRGVFFPADNGWSVSNNAGNDRLWNDFSTPISGRNGDITRHLRSPSAFIAGADANAVAMTVLPDAPVDPVSGLRVPTIAVATGGGISVIQDEGVVRNSSLTSSIDTIALTPSLLSAGRADGTWYSAANPGALGASFALTTRTNTQAPGFGIGNTGKLVDMGRARLIRRSSLAARAQMARAHESDQARSLVATVGDTFNSGWMTGDIRRAYLSDTEVGSLTGPELVTNGTFDSNTTGWTAQASATLSVEDGQLKVVSSSTNNTGAWQAITTVAGKTYQATASLRGSAGNLNLEVYNGAFATLIARNSTYPETGVLTAGTVVFTATGTETRIMVHPSNTATTYYADNISVTEVVADRSYKARAAIIEGTITRSQLASGTSLVGYSGFSADNYLQEPFSADLEFGTGEWSASAWVNIPTTLTDAMFPEVGANLWTLGDQTFSSIGAYSWTVGTNVQSFQTLRKSFKYSFTAAGVSGNALFREANSGGENSSAFPGWLNIGVNANGNYSGSFTAVGLGRIGFRPETTFSAEITGMTVTELVPVVIAERSHSSGAYVRLAVNRHGNLVAEAFDGTTLRYVATTASYNTAQWLKARVNYTTDGTLAILVNGREVAATRGAPLLTLNNASAVLTIGNSFALDAPFPGSIALLKLGATVPTPEQATFMVEQEKQLFRAGALSVLPDSGALVDMAYDDATDRWVAMSATNESYWTGLVRNSVQAVPAGSFSRVVAGSGLELAARTGTNPGVDVTIPAYGLREELVRRAEAASKLSKDLAVYDYVGGFTASTTNGSTAITSVAGLTYPASYIGARISGSGIPANTTIVAVSGTTIYLSAAATATATGVSISFLDFRLPVGMEAKAVMSAGALRQEGATKDFTRLYDGFIETIRFGVAPGATAWVQIQATRGTMQ